jgi:serine/threonine protein kinase
VLVSGDLACKLADFGVSREVVDAAMTVAGTPMYAAPEM